MPRTILLSPNNKPKGHSERGRNGPVAKGISADSEMIVDIDHLESVLANLRQHHRSLIKELSGEVLDNFQTVMQAVSVARGTEAYGVVHDLIRKHFDDLPDETCEIGSIQGYFNGCLLRTDLSGNPSCSPVCAGSMSPHPDLPGWQECQYLVIEYMPEAHVFEVKNKSIVDKTRAAIFIPEKTDFKGFRPDELKKLSDFGVKEVKLVKYASSSQYKEETTGFVPLATTSLQQDNNSSTGSSSGAAGWAILIIIVIIVLGLIALFAGAGMYGQEM